MRPRTLQGARLAPRHAPTQAAQGAHERLLPVRSVLDLHGDVGTTAALLAGRGDPASMSPEERLAELGEILARGFRRQHENRSNCLADRGQSERACELGVVNSPENPKEGIA